MAVYMWETPAVSCPSRPCPPFCQAREGLSAVKKQGARCTEGHQCLLLCFDSAHGKEVVCVFAVWPLSLSRLRPQGRQGGPRHPHRAGTAPSCTGTPRRPAHPASHLRISPLCPGCPPFLLQPARPNATSSVHQGLAGWSPRTRRGLGPGNSCPRGGSSLPAL